MEKDPEITGQQGSHLDFGARVYDSRIGRWTATDPLAAKYPNLGPYAFVGNMPIIAIDPDGKKIVIKYKNSQGKKKSYTYQPGVEYEGGNEFVKQTVTALNKLNENDTKGIIQDLVDMKRTRRIKHTKEKGGNSDVRNRALSNTVYWDPEMGIETIDEEGLPTSEYQSPALGLYHELGHAFNETTQKVKYWLRRFTKDDDYGTKEEKNVIENYETPMAKEMEEPVRENHLGHEVEVKGPLSNEPKHYGGAPPPKIKRKTLDYDPPEPEIKKP